MVGRPTETLNTLQVLAEGINHIGILNSTISQQLSNKANSPDVNTQVQTYTLDETNYQLATKQASITAPSSHSTS